MTNPHFYEDLELYAKDRIRKAIEQGREAGDIRTLVKRLTGAHLDLIALANGKEIIVEMREP